MYDGQTLRPSLSLQSISRVCKSDNFKIWYLIKKLSLSLDTFSEQKLILIKVKSINQGRGIMMQRRETLS